MERLESQKAKERMSLGGQGRPMLDNLRTDDAVAVEVGLHNRKKQPEDWRAVLADLTKALNIAQTAPLRRRLPDDVISNHMVESGSGLRKTFIVSEYGIYQTVFESSKSALGAIKMITDLDDIPYVFDCKTLAKILGVSTFTARNIMNSDGFPLRVYGPRSHRIWKVEFLRWMEGERFDATQIQT